MKSRVYTHVRETERVHIREKVRRERQRRVSARFSRPLPLWWMFAALFCEPIICSCVSHGDHLGRWGATHTHTHSEENIDYKNSCSCILTISHILPPLFYSITLFDTQTTVLGITSLSCSLWWNKCYEFPVCSQAVMLLSSEWEISPSHLQPFHSLSSAFFFYSVCLKEQFNPKL